MATLRLRQLVIHIPYDREKFIAIIITCIYNELIHYIKIQLCNKWNGHVLYISWEIYLLLGYNCTLPRAVSSH